MQVDVESVICKVLMPSILLLVVKGKSKEVKFALEQAVKT